MGRKNENAGIWPDGAVCRSEGWMWNHGTCGALAKQLHSQWARRSKGTDVKEGHANSRPAN
jgi:hypothetical protein